MGLATGHDSSVDLDAWTQVSGVGFRQPDREEWDESLSRTQPRIVLPALSRKPSGCPSSLSVPLTLPKASSGKPKF
jgi:hypothetical protein